MSARLPTQQRWYNAAGVSEAGLEVYTYAPGTTTQKATYYESQLITAHSNPILLDSSGNPPAPIYGGGAYKIVVKNSEGVTLYSEDNVFFDSIVLDESGGLTLSGPLAVGDIYIDGDLGIICDNCRYDGSIFEAISNGYASYRQFNKSTGEEKAYKTDVSVLAGADITSDLKLIYQRDKLGNTAEGGATLTGKTLDSNYEYHFNGLNVTQIKKTTPSKGVRYSLHNCYLTGSTYNAIENTGEYCTYTVQTPTAFAIRQSTVVVSAVPQSMIMSVVVPTT